MPIHHQLASGGTPARQAALRKDMNRPGGEKEMATIALVKAATSAVFLSSLSQEFLTFFSRHFLSL